MRKIPTHCQKRFKTILRLYWSQMMNMMKMKTNVKMRKRSVKIVLNNKKYATQFIKEKSITILQFLISPKWVLSIIHRMLKILIITSKRWVSKAKHLRFIIDLIINSSHLVILTQHRTIQEERFEMKMHIMMHSSLLNLHPNSDTILH